MQFGLRNLELSVCTLKQFRMRGLRLALGRRPRTAAGRHLVLEMVRACCYGTYIADKRSDAHLIWRSTDTRRFCSEAGMTFRLCRRQLCRLESCSVI